MKNETIESEKWATNQIKEKIKEIEQYISEGRTKDRALEIALKYSCLTPEDKAQVKYETYGIDKH